MTLTLLCVHAHPDDEASSTGGILARYAAEGITTVVVTCTNGELGDMPDGTKPGAAGHDPDLVRRTRQAELERACAILGVHHLERLGYRDSGMASWDFHHHPGSLAAAPPEEVAGRLVELFERYRPDVVVTYNDRSTYDHPDHLAASRATMAAVEASGIPKKAYFVAMRANRFARIRELLLRQGIELPPRPEPSPEWVRRAQEQEARINATVDVLPYVATKLEALRAHRSQLHNFMWDRLPLEALGEIFGQESFIRIRDETGAPLPESDLFAGLRS